MTRSRSMKQTLRLLSLALLAGACLVMAVHFSSPPPKITDPNDRYLEALSETDPANRPTLAPERAEAAIGRVKALFGTFSESNIRDRVRDVYAEKVYFRDGFRELTDREAIAAYMVAAARPLRSCSFEFVDVVDREGEVYIRWIMRVSLKNDPEDRVDEAIGMSHFRFDEEGRVAFQQDYWDPTDVLYARIPIANWLIRKVKERL